MSNDSTSEGVSRRGLLAGGAVAVAGAGLLGPRGAIADALPAPQASQISVATIDLAPRPRIAHSSRMSAHAPFAGRGSAGPHAPTMSRDAAPLTSVSLTSSIRGADGGREGRRERS